MTTVSRLVPSGSQTVGPFFSIGLEYLIDHGPQRRQPDSGLIEIRGQMLDANRVPVPDALLEFWGADSSGTYPTSNATQSATPCGFRRVATDEQGRFSCVTCKPGNVPLDGGAFQAPHLVVLVFARGLLRNLLTRVYLPHPPGIENDPVLSRVPESRRQTLFAVPDKDDSSLLHWNIVLQGEDETVFFAW